MYLFDVVYSIFLYFARWLNGLFSKGYDRRLEPHDMYQVLKEDSAEKLVADLERLARKTHHNPGT